MLAQREKTVIWLAASISAIILTAVIILAVIDREPAEQGRIDYHHHEHSPLKSRAENTATANHQKARLSDIIRSARSWKPIYRTWYGKTSPDFTLTDITGKKHKLSGYRGKDVLITFWATWCRPCLMEIPHLIELRNTISEDKLAMLAISNENFTLVKRFAASRAINYTILLDAGYMPAPYNRIISIPTSFFINPEGKIKLATEGLLSLSEIKAILQVESAY